jgi:hypothetical protein
MASVGRRWNRRRARAQRGLAAVFRCRTRRSTQIDLPASKPAKSALTASATPWRPSAVARPALNRGAKRARRHAISQQIQSSGSTLHDSARAMMPQMHSLCSLVLRRQRRRSAECPIVLSNRTTARTVPRTSRSLKRASPPADAPESSHMACRLVRCLPMHTGQKKAPATPRLLRSPMKESRDQGALDAPMLSQGTNRARRGSRFMRSLNSLLRPHIGGWS